MKRGIFLALIISITANCVLAADTNAVQTTPNLKNDAVPLLRPKYEIIPESNTQILTPAPVVNNIKTNIDNAKEQTTEIIKNTEVKVQSIQIPDIKQHTEEVKNSVQELKENSAQAIENKAEEIKSSVKEIPNTVQKAEENSVQDVVNKTEEVKNSVQELKENSAQAIENKTDEIKSSVKEIPNTVHKTQENSVQNVVNKAEEVKNSVQEVKENINFSEKDFQKEETQKEALNNNIQTEEKYLEQKTEEQNLKVETQPVKPIIETKNTELNQEETKNTLTENKKPSYAQELEAATPEEKFSKEEEYNPVYDTDEITPDFPAINMPKLKTNPVKIVPMKIDSSDKVESQIKLLNYKSYDATDEFIKKNITYTNSSKNNDNKTKMSPDTKVMKNNNINLSMGKTNTSYHTDSTFFHR